MKIINSNCRVFIRGFSHFLIILIFGGCHSSVKKDSLQSIPPVKFGNVEIPSPRFDRDILKMALDFQTKYQAKSVVISRPVWYISDTDYKYWLKVELVNPELGEKEFKYFGREVSKDLMSHLTNDSVFDKIEISKIQKTGFIITFTSSENAFYYRDSLKAF